MDSLVHSAVLMLPPLSLSDSSPVQIIGGDASLAGFINHSIMQAIQEKNKKSNSPPSTDNGIALRITKAGTQYQRYEPSQDTVYREIEFAGTWMLRGANAAMSVHSTEVHYKGLIARQDIEKAQNPEYAFCKAPVPAIQQGVASDILEPIIAITAAALTVFLLFSVRTQ
jgi:hypothetical protein